MIERIREEARKAFEEGKIEILIGFGRGTLRATPIFIEKKEDVDKLIWDDTCWINLATYLRRFRGKKTGIVAKGCDARSVVALIAEKQLKREDVYIIGVPCQGMKNEKGEEFLSCRYCEYPTPPVYDVLVGEKREGKKENYPDVSEFESMPPEKRWEFFSEEVKKCIRCYACREACPMCYCEECFADSLDPRWLEPGLSLSSLQFWHLVRAYHQAGRCSDCGACERACPMDVKILYLTRKLNKEVRELFGFVTGLDPEALPPLGTYSTEDKEEFIL
ncbi:4Fe-4S ferredoxin [bacterium]|nr:MAG: 4Fe-4S ferredoxin [bacterium]